MNVNDVPDMTVTFTCLGAPLQMEGKIGDTDVVWYYRERHGRWRVECPRGKEIANGTSLPDHEQSIPVAMRRVIEAIWHPFLCDWYNKRTDAEYDAIDGGPSRIAGMTELPILDAVRRMRDA